ncbi:MAG: PD-(D/E)XK nuclease family protein [Thermoleophilia bacterium]
MVERARKPLKLICGPTGSGKTTRAIEAFLAAIDRGESAAFIAPSRPDCLHFERRILESRPVLAGGGVNTFDEILRETIAGEADSPRLISEVERHILIRAIMDGPGMPETLRESSQYDGFIEELLGLIDDLEGAGVGSVELGEGLKEWAGDDAWRQGFNKDLFRIYKEYEAVMAEKGVEDSARREHRASMILGGDTSILEYGTIVVDGFHDFTPLQMDLLTSLRESGAELLVTLPYMEGKAALTAPGYFFDQLSEDADVVFLEATYEDDRVPAIRHIAEQLFEENQEVRPADGAVIVLQAAGVRGQAELVAAEVLRLWREDGIELDDMAVVTRGPGADTLAMATVFDDYGIPYEMHAKVPLASAAVGSTAIAALSLAAALELPGACDDGAERLTAYLRSPLYLADPDTIDGFDRHLRSLRGAKLEDLMLEWKKRSNRPLDEVDRLLAASRQGMESLADELMATMRTLVKAGSRKNGLEAIASDAKALNDLASICADISCAQDLVFDYPQAQIAEDITPGSRKAHRIIRVIEAAATRPPSGSRRNCLRLLDPHRVLNQRFDAVFVCGLLEGQFPNRGRDNVFLTMGDREWLRENSSIALKTDALRLDEERFLFQRTLTRARLKAYLCYPYCDQAGKPMVPSLFVTDTLDLFEEGSVGARNKSISEVSFRIEEAPNSQQALLALASIDSGDLSRSPALLKGLEKAAATVGLDQRLKHCLESRVPKWAVLGEEIKGRLAEKDYFHVTELERYLECPFRYFVEKLVRPQPLEADDFFLVRGSVIHDILCEFYRTMQKASVDLAHAKEGQIAEARRIMAALVDEKAAVFGDDLKSGVVRSELAVHLDRFISREQDIRPEFSPHKLEWRFGTCDAGLPDEKSMIKLGDVKLCGRVDRIDSRGKINQAIVIDYKTGAISTESSQAKFAEKGKFQVPIYMYAVQEILGFEVLAGEYCSVLRNGRRGLYLEEYADALGKGSRETVKTDFVDQETFEERLETARKQAKEAADGIRNGSFDCKQSEDTCKYCGLDCLCRAKAADEVDRESVGG